MSHKLTVLVLLLFACMSYGVQTSLYFPGFDSQPLSADFVSTDSGGHTVWSVHVTQEAGGNFGSPGAMTLTEGSIHTSIGAFTQGTNEACGSDAAMCTAPLAVATGTVTAVSQLPTDLGTTPPETAELSSGTVVPSLFPTSAKSAIASSTASPSRTNAAATTTPETNSNSASLGKSTIGLKVSLALVAFFSLYFAF
ncbi:hypothetical protein APHAL10511_004299 [Amanita phalloides]|nr:hypothetical protein APHAL10511_004299 [Amanita phalloides]